MLRQVAALLGQMISVGSRRGGALHVVGNFLDGRCHLRNGRGRLVGFAALAIEQLRLGARQVGRLRGTRLHAHAGIHQAGQRGLQARFFTEDCQVQLALQAAVVAIGQGHQGAGEGFRVFVQGTTDHPVVPRFDQVPGAEQTGHQYAQGSVLR
ncbi:hypothetical protein D3C79_828840 [compost metagenome]